MCGRYSLTDCEEKIIFYFGLHNSKVILKPRYNIYPSEKIPIIVQRDGLLQLEFMKWGLIPIWSKSRKPFINARVETIKEKPSFRQAIKKRRCLVPANGFYEWTQEKYNKQPYFICLKNYNLLAFAGIWEEWISDNGEVIRTCAILTTAANSSILKIHNRMPIILNKNNFSMWLNFSEISLKEFYENSQSDILKTWKVDKKISSTYFDNPNCIKKIEDNIIPSDNKIFSRAQETLFD